MTKSETTEIKSDRIIGGYIEIVNKDGSLKIREYKPKYSENDLREIFGLPPLSGECYTRKKWNPPHFLQIIKNEIISQNDRR